MVTNFWFILFGKFKFLRVSDGSGKGAAVVVAIANKLKQHFKDS